MMGEVVGKAASICVNTASSPRAVYKKHLSKLIALLKEPGTKKRRS
jgi:hypothetical protein